MQLSCLQNQLQLDHFDSAVGKTQLAPASQTGNGRQSPVSDEPIIVATEPQTSKDVRQVIGSAFEQGRGQSNLTSRAAAPCSLFSHSKLDAGFVAEGVILLLKLMVKALLDGQALFLNSTSKTMMTRSCVNIRHVGVRQGSAKRGSSSENICQVLDSQRHLRNKLMNGASSVLCLGYADRSQSQQELAGTEK
ncbi:MAG: hypothetical protein FRX49_09593 [Trebouxia sp. A1-2]|nr:MAG: hypothetical protein FRX49_09593 [Trebouxia sp. A1-2]